MDQKTLNEIFGGDESSMTLTFTCAPTEASTEPDMVNHPPHYTQGGIECIEAIESATGEYYAGYLQGQIIKYIWRYRYKNGKEDLEKAEFYLKRLIELQDLQS